MIGKKGGNFKFERLLHDLRRLLADKTAYCTTFFDFYGLPESFPGKKEANTKYRTNEKANCLLDALKTELKRELKEEDFRQVIPYVQMYEFEGLLFSDPEKLAKVIGRVDLCETFRKIRESFKSPEDINNSPDTAPSKCIIKHDKSYQKVVDGVDVAQKIGLEAIRKECHRFDDWLNALEALKLM